MAKGKAKDAQEKDQEKDQESAEGSKAQADDQAQEQAREQHRAREADAHGKGESPAARAEREADAKEQERARADRGDKAPDRPPPGTDGMTGGAARLREAAQAFAQGPRDPAMEEGTAPEPGGSGGVRGASGGGSEDLTEGEIKQVEAYKKLLRSRRSGEPSPGGIDPFAIPEDQGGPPRMSPEEIERGREDASRAGNRPREAPAGETDPRAIPTLAKEQGDPTRAAYGAGAGEGEQPPQVDPERVPTEGEIAANVAVLRTKGDTSPMHPMYRSEAVNLPTNRAQARGADPGETPIRTFKVVSGQVGAIASPDRGGPRRSYTLDEMGIPEGSIPRLVRLGVIVEDDPR